MIVDRTAQQRVEQRLTQRAPWPRIRLGLVTRIFILIGLILSVYAGDQVYDGLKRRAAAEAELRSQASSLARIAALDVERTFEAAHHALTVLANTQAIRDHDLAACSVLLRSVKRDLPMYDFISLDEMDGRILCHNSLPAGHAGIRGDPWHIASAAATREYVVGLYGQSRSTGNEVIRLSYPVLAGDGGVDTVLVAGLNLKWLSSSIAKWQLPATSVIDIADRNGTLLARYPRSDTVGRGLPEGLRSAIKSSESGVRPETGRDGVSRVYGYVPVSFGGAPSILVAVGLDSKPALAEIDRSVRRFVVSASVLLLGVGVAAWVYIHRFIRRPMEALLHAAARWQAGDWTVRAGSRRGIVEMESLADAFDKMAETVAARESALRESAASLQRSQQHLTRAQRLAAVGSWESDCRDGTVEWSDEYYRILGVSRDSFQPTPEAFHRMVVEEDRAMLRGSIAQLREGRSVPPLEFRAVRADGAIRHLYREAEPLFDTAGKPIGYCGSVRDVTEARENEQRLRRSREHLAHAQRVAEIGSFELNLATNRLEWSDETYRIFGVSRDNGPLDTAAVEAMILPEDRDCLRATIALVRQGHTDFPPEYRIRRTDGAIRTIYRDIEPVLDKAGNVIGLFGLVKDVTELHDAEQRRDELERQLMHSQKLEALGTLAGGIAHDLNNTLVPIVALSKLAADELPKNNAARGDIETIIRASERARDLVKQILAFSRKQDLMEQEVDLALVTRDALEMLRASLPSTIQIVHQILKVPLLFGDAGQLHQVIVNLVTNAAQAIGGDVGRITVRLWAVAGQETSLSGATGSTVSLSVADTGCGIDEATLNRIFEPFFTTKGVGEGTGLGLSVVHGIITHHHGAITVRSKPGEGTEFTLSLPALDHYQTAAPAASVAAA